MTKIEELLKESFIIESQANVRYLIFATRAEREGYTQVAKLFRATAESATVQARNYSVALGAVQRTEENLLKAIASETHEIERTYPEMINAAKTEAHRSGEAISIYANKVKQSNIQLYQKMLDELGRTQEIFPYFVCPVCGYASEEDPPIQCPICGAKGELFERID
jgi:rubrerythrin